MMALAIYSRHPIGIEIDAERAVAKIALPRQVPVPVRDRHAITGVKGIVLRSPFAGAGDIHPSRVWQLPAPLVSVR